MNLQSFDYYLQAEGLQASSISEHLKNIERFIWWVKENELTDIALLNYNEIMSYVQYLKSKSLSIQTVNIHINSVRKYYEHLKQENIIEKNPTRKLHIKGAIKKVIQNPLNFSQLEELYQHYLQYLDQRPLREINKQQKTNLRSKIIVGLMIWQGLHSGEIAQIETSYINIHTGILYVPSTGRSNSRELKLATEQILLLHTYISSLPANQTKLINCNVHNQIVRIVNELRGINGMVQNSWHIRASVIFYWLKLYDKRQVQYMLGHKWISSIEQYQQQDMETLTDLLSKHHPFS